MILKFCERTSPIGPLHHELHVLKDGQFCTPGSTPGVQVASDDRFFLTPLSPANPRAERKTEETRKVAGTDLRFS